MKSKLILFCLFAICQPGLSQICNIYCDDRDPSSAVNTRIPVSVDLFARQIQLYISDEDNMGFAEISNGNANDEVWIDRSMNGGLGDWEGHLGDAFIPSTSKSVRTNMYNVDNPSGRQIGALRACGKAGDREDIACTSWARSTVNADQQVDAAVTALMQMFDGTLWPTTGWWNGANCLTAMTDYFKVTGNTNYRYVINEVFEKNKDREDGNFTNFYIDDTLWWGLVWVNSFDLTGDSKYLEMAKLDADYCYEYKDDVCGGGLWWTNRYDYKNAIPNELFIKLAAALHNRIPGDTKYLNRAIEVWNWFKSSGMINSENLINDGLDIENCQNNGRVTWTYNQGVILGGLVELHKATGTDSYLEEARKIADAVLSSSNLNPNGILYEYGCEGGGNDCGGDASTFKGIFNRNLGELDRYLNSIGQGRPYKSWLENQTRALWDNTRNSLNQFGVHWAGPFDKAHAGTQHSAVDAFVAAA